jgi:hypothetical protein
MQTIAPASPRHFAPSELIDNDDLVFLNDVLNIFLEQAVGPQQLRDVVYPFCLRVAMLLPLRFSLVFLFLREIQIEIDLGELVDQIR